MVTEELQITNMTRSARGTADRPGRNVRAKSGLNRSILRQGWGDFKTKLDYKAAKAGIRHVEIYPGGTSQTCNQCGERDPRSRASQSEFRCTSCSYSANADMNAAINIGDRGLYYLQKRFGKTPESIRLARLGSDPGCGEKTGIQPAERTSRGTPESSEPRTSRSNAIFSDTPTASQSWRSAQKLHSRNSP